MVHSMLRLPNHPLPHVEMNAGSPQTDHCLLDAKTDREAIFAWVNRFQSPDTKASYLKEADRFYRWALICKDKPVSLITHEEFQEYLEFMQNPQPAVEWISNTKFSRTNPGWRPFYSSGTYSVKQSSLKQSTIILDTLFSWLVESRYLAANPISLVSKRAKTSQVRKLERFLPTNLIIDVHQYLDTLMSQENDTSASVEPTSARQLTLVRLRWIFSALFLTGLRISEMASTKMSAIYCDRRRGQQDWWMDVIGKGGKLRKVPLNDEFMNEYRRYLKYMGLSEIVGSDEFREMPLVISLRVHRKNEPMSRSSIHREVKKIADETIEFVKSQGRQDEARLLKQMSAHWLRHSYATALGDSGADLRTIQENLGHSNIQTSSIYLHANDSRRHSDAQQVSLKK